jgi:phosphoribosylanthranilate isomerase
MNDSVPTIRVKICGITRAEDARCALDAGADAIGLNFYQRSRRFIAPDQADAVCAAVAGSGVRVVGVFVNASRAEILGYVDRWSLDAVQLHGDEPPEFAAELSGLRVVRALRVAGDDFESARLHHRAMVAAGCPPWSVLLDALDPGNYGGTGHRLAWPLLAEATRSWREAHVPWILAGGLTDENVAVAIRTAWPGGVDVASGVESSPGIKDHARIKRFVEQALAALAEVSIPRD